MNTSVHIKVDGEEIPVYQTPSHITYMCLMTPSGWVSRPRGKQAKRTVRAYLAWAEYTYPEHKQEQLWDAITSCKKIEVYAL
jgi:hypothetical protein